MVQALELPSLNISIDFKLSLKIIHSEIRSLMAKNAELKTQQAQYLRVSNEKESLFQELEKAKVHLNDISSEVMVEDSLMMKLAVEMRELQVKMDDSRARWLLRSILLLKKLSDTGLWLSITRS